MPFDLPPFRKLRVGLPVATLALLAACGGGGGSDAATPHTAYILNENDTVWTMSEDAGKGTLDLAQNQVNTDWGSKIMVTDPQKRYLYVGNNGGPFTPTITTYSLTASDHRPVQLGSGIPASTGAAALAMSPNGTFLYSGGDAGILTFRLTNGTPTQVGGVLPSGHGVTDLAVDPTGHFLYAVNGYTSIAGTSDDTVRVYSLDAATGAPTATGALYATAYDPVAVRVNPNGKAVYVVNLSGQSLSQFTRNAQDGSLTPQVNLPTGTSSYIGGLTLDRFGAFLYLADPTNGGVKGFKVNGDGTLSSLGAVFDAHDYPQALALDPEGGLLFTTNYNNSITAFRVDMSTGRLTYVGKSPMGGTGKGILFR
ncbi:MAG TPA: beta-propeller fold lactonase family protein [Holophagaceae bacterium]|nr:beta-propeller fold lactonase family protein [Holophagaceae bacterium]